jgi:hypothetical protein
MSPAWIKSKSDHTRTASFSHSLYRAVRKWAGVLCRPGASAARRKKAIVAVARQLAVDLWRLACGQVTAAELGLVVKATAV